MSNVSVMLIGFGTVFVGLICLIYITKLMSAVVKASERKKQAAPAAAAAAPAPVAAAGAIPNRGAFAAAVAASIATVIGTEVEGLRIVSVKKVN